VESLRGKLLIAGGALFDPNFRQTIVLIAEHTEEGALGVVLNRPAETIVEDAIPALGELVAPGDPLFVGGPVLPQGAVILGSYEHPDFAEALILGSIGLVGEEEGRVLSEGVQRARVYAGHAGWGAGQLEAELEADSWIVDAALEEDVFTDHPERLWRAVLERKGRGFELLSRMPFDPSRN
jgi:putative transcriptional regulator